MIAVLLFLLQGMTAFLPVVHGGNGQGMAGPGDMRQVNAAWYHTWQPCWNNRQECVDAVKDDRFLTDEVVRGVLETCRSGYLLLLNEPVLNGYSLEWQAETLHRIDNLRQEVNSSCRLLCCGTVAYHPDILYAGTDWLREFKATYETMYSEPPPVDGIHFHAYWFNYNHQEDALAYIDLARELYPDAELWITEYGSLVAPGFALWAIDDLEVIAPEVDRWAFFISYEREWGPFSLFDSVGRLTRLGQAYRDFGRNPRRTSFESVPAVSSSKEQP